MAKEDEGERSEQPQTAAERKARRFSSAEMTELVTALFALLAHADNKPVHPSLLAHALMLRARVLGEFANVSRATTPEDDDAP